MRKWTESERKRQAELARKQQPWKVVGVKSKQTKAASAKNALKHGMYGAETRELRESLALCRERLREWGVL